LGQSWRLQRQVEFMWERGRPVAVHLVNIVTGGNGKFIRQANDDKIKKPA